MRRNQELKKEKARAKTLNQKKKWSNGKRRAKRSSFTPVGRVATWRDDGKRDRGQSCNDLKRARGDALVIECHVRDGAVEHMCFECGRVYG